VISKLGARIRVAIAMHATVVVLPLGLALFTSPASAAVIDLDFNSLPSAQEWTYRTSLGVDEENVFSVDGEALHQNSVGLLDDPKYVWQGSVQRTPFDLRFRARLTEFDGVVDSAFGFSVLLGVEDFFVYVGLGLGYVEVEENVVGNPRVYVDTSQFHDYRLLGDPVAGSYRFFVDGAQVLSRTIGHNPLGDNFLMLGDRALAGGDSPLGGQADVSLFVLEYVAQQIAIDIKPGSINPRSRGKIRVAILTTGSFDAATVDATRVRFGRTGSEGTMLRSALQDIDGDGDLDMSLQFNTQGTGIDCSTASASITGATLDETAIQGTASIKIVGCR
jgi:hypothetical protein